MITCCKSGTNTNKNWAKRLANPRPSLSSSYAEVQDYKVLVGVCAVGRAKAAKRWRDLESRLQVGCPGSWSLSRACSQEPLSSVPCCSRLWHSMTLDHAVWHLHPVQGAAEVMTPVMP